MEIDPGFNSPGKVAEREKQRLLKTNVTIGYFCVLMAVMSCGVFLCKRETFLIVATCALVAIGLFLWHRAKKR